MSGTIYDHRNPTWLISSTPLSWDKPTPPSPWNPAHWFDKYPPPTPIEGDDGITPCNINEDSKVEEPKHLLVGKNGKPKQCKEITQQDLNDGIAAKRYSNNEYGAHFASVGTKCEDFIGVSPLDSYGKPRRPDLPFDSEFHSCKTRAWGEDGDTLCVDQFWNCTIEPQQAFAQNKPGIVIDNSRVGPGNKLYSKYSNIVCQLGTDSGDPRFGGRWPHLKGNPPVRTWKPIGPVLYEGAIPSWRNICANYWPSDPYNNWKNTRCTLKEDIDYSKMNWECSKKKTPMECENADPLDLVEDGTHGLGCVWKPEHRKCERQDCEEMESINGFCPTVMCDWNPQDGPDTPAFGTGTRPVWPPPPAPPPPPPPPSPCQNNVLDLEPNPFLPPGQESDQRVTKYYIYNQMCKAAETGRMVDGKDESEELCGIMNDNYKSKLGVNLCQHTQVNGGKSPGTCRIRECSDMYKDVESGVTKVCPEEMIGKDGTKVQGPCVLWDWNKK